LFLLDIVIRHAEAVQSQGAELNDVYSQLIFFVLQYAGISIS